MVIEWAKAANAVYNFISLMMTDEISAGKSSIKNVFFERIHRYKIKRYCRDFFRRNYGTVISNPVFYQWIQNDGTIERLFKHTGTTHADVTDAEYIDAEINRIKKDIEHPLDGRDITAIRDFLGGLITKHREYREKSLSSDSKQIIQNNDRNTKELSNAITGIKDVQDNILELVANSKGNLSVDQEYDIHQKLNNSFWEGDFDLLRSIIPAIREKSNSLDEWVNFVLSKALVDGKKYRTNYSLKDIDNISIREDAVRKAIIFSYLQEEPLDSYDFLLEGDLGELVSKMQTGDAWLFDEKKEVRNNVDCYTLTPFTSLKSESETVKILQTIKAFRMQVPGAANVIDAINGNRYNYLTTLLKEARHYTEGIARCTTDAEAVELSVKTTDSLWGKKDLYSLTGVSIQKIYWRTIIQAFSISEKKKLSEVIQNIPNSIHEELSECILIARIKCRDIERDEFLELWRKNRNYDILNAYLINFKASDAKSIVADFIPEAMESPEVVLNLVDLFFRDGDDEEAEAILNSYKSTCDDYAEYYIDIYRLSKDKKDVDILEDRWIHQNLKYLSMLSDSTIAHIFYDCKKYEMCLNVLKSLEIKGVVNYDLRKLYAFALINAKKSIEGLSALNNLMPEGKDDLSVIRNILYCSLGLQREVSEEVINAADKLKTPELMLYLGAIYEQRNDIQTAKKYYWKTLLANSDDKSKIYGVYWAFSIKHLYGDIKPDVTDEGTCIIAKRTDGDDTVSLGILGKEYVDSELNVENINVFSTDNAIKNGWLNKIVGTNIDFKGKTYIIKQIITMDACFSSLCCQKLVKTGAAKAFTLPTDVSLEQARNSFIDFFKSNMPSVNKSNELINDYKDLSKLPLTLHGLFMHGRSNYIVAVYSLLKESSIVTREWITYEKNDEIKETKGYMLTFSSLILLFLLKVPAELLEKNKVFIPKSMLIDIRNEKDEVISEKKRGDGGSITVIDDHIQVYMDSEETKQELMTYAIDLLDYAERIPVIDSKKDFVTALNPEVDLRDFLGTPDLDALSICEEYGYSLVSFEVWLTDINMISKGKSVTIIEFLNEIEKDDLIYMRYLVNLQDFRMMNVLDTASLNRIMNSDKKEVYDEWGRLLTALEKQDGYYKDWLREHLTHINQKYQEIRKKDKELNDAERDFYALLMKLLEREIHVSTGTLHDDEGNPVIRTYMRVFDKRSQSYLEDLDQIFDTVLKVDFSVMEDDGEKD